MNEWILQIRLIHNLGIYMESRSICIIFGIVASITSAYGQSMPTGCSYDAGLYECDYSTLSGSSQIPLQASGFSPIPQRMKLTGLPATLNSAVFDTDFASLDNGKFSKIVLWVVCRFSWYSVIKWYLIYECLTRNKNSFSQRARPPSNILKI